MWKKIISVLTAAVLLAAVIFGDRIGVHANTYESVTVDFNDLKKGDFIKPGSSVFNDQEKAFGISFFDDNTNLVKSIILESGSSYKFEGSYSNADGASAIAPDTGWEVTTLMNYYATIGGNREHMLAFSVRGISQATKQKTDAEKLEEAMAVAEDILSTNKNEYFFTDENIRKVVENAIMLKPIKGITVAVSDFSTVLPTCTEKGVIRCNIELKCGEQTKSREFTDIPVVAQGHDFQNGKCTRCEMVIIDETNFPDERFRDFVTTKYDKNDDGYLSDNELRVVIAMSPGSYGYNDIKDFKGLEFFTSMNQFEYTYSSEEIEIDFGNNPVINSIILFDGSVTGINISGCTNLKELRVENNRLSSLDVRQNHELMILDCHGNQLTSLDVSRNTKLVELNCGNNRLSEIDVSNNTALQFLHVDRSPMSSIDISKNTELTTLNIQDSKFTSVDLSKNTKLEKIYFANNKLTSITFPDESIQVWSYGNNSYGISVGCDRKFDLSTLPGSFDLRKAYDWTGGTVEGNILTIDEDADKVTYKYKAKYNKKIAKDEYILTDFISFKLVVTADEHDYDYDNGNITREPTCTEKGEVEYTCTVCGKVKSEEIDIDTSAHSLAKTDEVKATCTEAGNIEYWTCSDCGRHFSDELGTNEVTETVISAKGHELTKTDAKDATCTEDGNIEYWTCSDCGKYFSDELGTNEVTETVVPAKGHELTKTDAKDATCTEDGNIEYWTCSDCGKYFSDSLGAKEIIKAESIVSAKGHTEVVDEAVEPSCTETGLTEGSHCSVCDTVIAEQEVVPAKGHTEVVDEAVEPTLTGTGLTEGKHCSVCNEIIVKQEVIPTTGHKWDEGKITKEPTADAEGEKIYTCTDCGKTKIEKISRINPENPNAGNVLTEVESGINVPETTMDTPPEELSELVLTDDDKTTVEHGTDIKISLVVEDGTDKAPVEDRTKVEEKIVEMQNCKLGQYLDVNLLKIIGEKQEKITETSEPITITFELPEALRGKDREYSVIRVHNGETTALYDLDDNENTVTIATDKFSTYALVYSEKAADSSDSEVSSDSEASSGDNEESSDNSDTSSDDENSGDNSGTTSDDNSGTSSGENPETGIVISVIPLTAALSALVLLKRRKK